MTIRALYPSIEPTLDLNFALSKRLDPRVTFTRGSAGTYFDKDGILRTAAANQPRFDHNPSTNDSLGLLVEEARTNDISYSESFTGANWDVKTNVNVIPNAGLAPNNTFTATNLVATAVNGNHLISLYNPHGSASSLSLFVKPNGYNQIGLVQNGFQPNALAVFTLTGTGSVSGAGQTIQQCPNGWYRIVYNFGTGLNRYDIYIYNSGSASFAGDGTSGLLIWGVQWETGTFPTSYIPTPATFTSRASTATYYDANGIVQTAASGVARNDAYFPDSNGVMRSAGLLLEAAGTNLALHSEALGSWTNNGGGIAITSNVEVAPDGTTTADRLAQSATTNATRALYNLGTSVRSGQTFTTSFWMKRVSGTDAQPTFIVNGIGGGPGQAFTVTTSWKRYSFTWTAINDGGTYEVGSLYFSWDINGAANNNVYSIWGFQVEQNSYATSYIPTTTATVTRAADVSSSATVTRSADVASITGTNFSSWYNQSEGTLFADVSKPQNVTQDTAIFSVDDGSSNNQIRISQFSSGNYMTVRVGGVNSLDANIGALTQGVSYKNTLAYKAGSIAAVLNAGSPTTSSGAVPSTLTTARIGLYTGGAGTANSTIRRLTYWPTRLSNAILQAITL